MSFKRIFFSLIFCSVIALAYGFSVNFDANNDGKSDKWLELDAKKKWNVYDVNGNNKPDESIFYINEKKMIYVIISQRIDYTGNGKPDIWIKNTFKGKNFTTTVKIDSNKDGKVDLVQYKENDVLVTEQSDSDYDNVYDVFTEYFSSGKRKKEAHDQNKDGVPDDFYFFLKSGEPIKQELDSNYDKRPDCWVDYEYDKEMKLKRCIMTYDGNYDGKVDEWHYTNEFMQMVKVEKDTNFDGKPDSVKKY